MACVCIRQNLLCEPADMEREIAAGWSVENPVTEIVHEETEEDDSEQTEEESEKRRSY